MKIYKSIVMDWNGNVIFEKSFDYDGELDLLKGGKKGGGYTPPPPPVQKAQTKAVDESQTAARENQRQKAQRAKGIKSSILTQDKESTGSTGAGKSLLGQ